MSRMSIVPFIPKVPKVLHKLRTSTVTAGGGQQLAEQQHREDLAGLGKMPQTSPHSFLGRSWRSRPGAAQLRNLHAVGVGCRPARGPWWSAAEEREAEGLATTSLWSREKSQPQRNIRMVLLILLGINNWKPGWVSFKKKTKPTELFLAQKYPANKKCPCK